MKNSKGFLTGLKGIGIGDGFTSPFEILSEVGMFSYHLSLIDYQERAKVQKILLRASRNNKNNQWNKLHTDFDEALEYIVDRAGNINIYDIREDGEYEELLEPYFHDP